MDEPDKPSPLMDEQPLTGPQRVVRALTFWSKVVPILAAYKAVEVTAGGKTEKELNDKYEELHDWGSDRLQGAINELKGFYVKTGQVISTRVDLFPEQYTSKLASLQDDLDALPAEQIKAVVQRELLLGEPLETIFASFEDEPLGSASIAQVHEATLLDGRRVAVKVQRPNAEPKLRGDIANLKSFSKKLSSALPIDYYTVFCELETALNGELDFLAEAQAAMKVFASVSHTCSGDPTAPAVKVPLPVQGLSSRRVLVMEFVEGTPLNKLADVMEKRGIKPGSPESKIAGVRILEQLTTAFGRMMLGAGFIHGDPHPGNIFVQEGAKVALIDCGQVKQIPQEARLRLAEAILLVNEWQETGGSPRLIDAAQEKMAGFGVTFANGTKPEAAAALALLLFGDPETPMPGGFSSAELSADSPIKAIASFPQELVLLGRATILIKGISKRLGISWSLASKWKAMANAALECGEDGCMMPTWSAVGHLPGAKVVASSSAAGGTAALTSSSTAATDRLRFREVVSGFAGSAKLLGRWAVGKAGSMAGVVTPPPLKKFAIRIAAERIERKASVEESS
uniref:Protein kinase domain-containing protein n=1 Tax=Haptolina brevifila TaxID=156173 RepID=A0A7S2N3Z5_9EUKA